MKGYIHLYTGHGKGKTTAAIGLAVRAAGAGKKVFIGQFIKGMPYAELSALKKLPEITVKQFGRGCFIENKPTQEDINAAREGLTDMAMIIPSNEYEVIIMDEVCIALYYNLFTTQELLNVLSNRTENLEIILTGRHAPPELYQIADLITEMKEIKHYYNNGIQAREGIEY
ncbi:MAG: Cob(I)yrinic acid a,c-diamide adenosyltransferase [Bacteroidetes bacterium ADurb.Bin408]|nr:MAG: Cob(I)yrinic acid a,c-diamide adenosyltransferase [Bacteroidetes bacterium ADurb.Bin408]